MANGILGLANYRRQNGAAVSGTRIGRAEAADSPGPAASASARMAARRVARRVDRAQHGFPFASTASRFSPIRCSAPRSASTSAPMTIGLKRLVAPALQVSAIPAPGSDSALARAHGSLRPSVAAARWTNRESTVMTASSTSDLLRVDHYRAVQELKWNETAQIGPASSPRVRGEALGRAHAQRYASRLQRLPDRVRPLSRGVCRRHGVYGFVPPASDRASRWIWRSCRSARTTRGFTRTAIPSRRWRWPMTRAPISCFRCITRLSS